MGQSHWSDKDTETAVRMKAEGYSHPEIGARVGRSPKAVSLRFLYLRSTPEQRRGRRGVKVRKEPEITLNFVSSVHRPTPEQVLERDIRFSYPRTFSQVYLGDPLPGQSALDKRNQESRHG
jgi:hypothetical protein